MRKVFSGDLFFATKRREFVDQDSLIIIYFSAGKIFPMWPLYWGTHTGRACPGILRGVFCAKHSGVQHIVHFPSVFLLCFGTLFSGLGCCMFWPF